MLTYTHQMHVWKDQYGHCFLQSVTYLAKHAHTQGRNSPLFHWCLQGRQVFPNFLLAGLLKVEDKLRATEAQKPPEVTGTFTGTPRCADVEDRTPPAQGKSSPAPAGRWIHKYKEISLAPGEGGRSQDSLFIGSSFLDFHILEKSIFLLCLEELTA